VNLFKFLKRESAAHAENAATDHKVKMFGGGKNMPPLKVTFRGYGSGSASGMYEAADTDRLTASWTTQPISTLQLVERNWRILCARGRECAHNTAHGKRFLRLVRTHIVGPNGVQIAPSVKKADGQPDKLARDAIMAAWKEWGKYPEITGCHTWRALQGLAIQTVARDGEVFIHRLKGRAYGPYRYQLQLIDPTRIPPDYRARLRNGNRIRAGIEFTDVGKPVAYYVRADAEDYIEGQTHEGAQYQRIPADEIIHLFLPDMINQPRGLSWMGTALKRLHHLSKYEEAAVVNARIGASKMGFFEVNPEYYEGFDDDEEGEDVLPMDAEPGTFERLPAGHTFSEWNPQYPQGEFEGFVKANLHSVAAGLGVSYASLTGDLSKVNYSSIRAGAIDERDMWMDLQEWFIAKFVAPVFEDWVAMAVLAGAIRIGTTPLKIERVSQYQKARYQARRWKWADPSKDVKAVRDEHAGLMKSVSATIREQGLDPEDVYDEIAEERERWRSLGITPDAHASAPEENAENAEPETDD